MVLVRRIHKRNANIVVEANAEVLFTPESDVGVWQRRFSARVREAAAAYAPSNKRPRWGHYGKPLKTTFTASTTYQPGRMRIYSAVGSTSPHAYYVDQGTGIYNGSGPYPAKILPPWHRGSPSLYEATWIPPGSRHRVQPVMIKGQRGQEFFDKGLRRGFESMRMRSYQVPGEGLIGGVMNAVPTGLTNFLGNTAVNGAFLASLAEWRSWRDAAYNSGRVLGNGGYTAETHRRHIAARQRAAQREQRKIRRAQQSAIRSKAWRDKQKSLKSDAAKSTAKKPRQNAQVKALQMAKNEMYAYFMKHPGAKPGGYNSQGFWVVSPNGSRKLHYWSIPTADQFAEAGVQHKAAPKIR